MARVNSLQADIAGLEAFFFLVADVYRRGEAGIDLRSRPTMHVRMAPIERGALANFV